MSRIIDQVYVSRGYMFLGVSVKRCMSKGFEPYFPMYSSMFMNIES